MVRPQRTSYCFLCIANVWWFRDSFPWLAGALAHLSGLKHPGEPADRPAV